LFLAGAIIMAFNLWKTVTSGETAAPESEPALAPAE
jgi:cbb3-type cytochrome oxidase subunit 1